MSKRTPKATAKHLTPPAPTDAYLSFLARKAAVSPATGFEPSLPLNPALFPFQRDVVAWALRRGRAALFEDCFLPGTLIFADGAYRPIEECHENMAIETLFGASTIERTMSKNYDGEVVEVKTGSGFFPVTVTKDHKFYVLRRQQCVIGSRTNTHCSTACDRQCPAETKPHDGYRIELVAAKDLTLSDCLLFRQPREGHGAADASDAYLRLAGLWLAEGHLTRANGKLYGIHLSFCLDEEHTLVKDAVEALAQLGVRARIGRSKEKQNVLLVEASNHELATRLFEDFNELSHGKRLPAWFFRLVPEKQRILLRGLFEGDAHIRMAPPSASKAGKLSQFIKFVTVSYELASGVRDALLGMGVRCSALVDVAKTDKRGTNHRQAYRMLIARRFMGMFGYPVDVIRRDLRQVEHVEAGQTYTLIPVRALHKRHYKGPVYNLTSAGHDSYLTDAGVSKNCGMGKSLQQLEWARHVVAHTGKPVLILTPLAVAAQTEREAARFGIDAAVVEDAAGIGAARVYITNYEKLHKFNAANFGGVVLDECFAAGTMIDVVAKDGSTGRLPIEEVRAGHRILNASGIDTVSDVHRREVPYAVIVQVQGRSITCSPNHPFFTRRGWVGAQDLEPGDLVMETSEAMRVVRGDVRAQVAGPEVRQVLREILLSEMAHEATGGLGQGPLAGGGGEAGQVEVQVASVGAPLGAGRDGSHPGDEPIDQPGDGEEDLPPIESHGARSFRAWGQWSRSDRASEDAAGCAWTDMGSGVSLVVGPTDSGLSLALQARLGERRAASRYRGGWLLSREPQGPGREEGCEAGFARVEGLEVLQPGDPRLERLRSSDGKLYFYDLGGTRHPSFSVGGLLVHNSSILKSYDGKTRTQIVESFRHTPYKLACTATPAPNDHEELGNHAEFLGVMSRTEMLASFFCHDGGETQVWRLKGHAEGIFWAWVASWAVSLRSPADLGYEAAGFALPGLVMHRHLLPLDGFSNARGLLFETGDGFGLSERREARRASLAARVAKVAALVAAEPSEPWLIWCGLNAEGDAITKAIADAVQVAGADSAEDKTARMLGFSDGAVRVLVTKSGIAGFGMNWQHCARMIFAGMDDSYESFYQTVRRCYRFGQTREVQVHIVASEPEGIVIDNVLRKEREHMKMLGAMAEHARQVQIANVRGAQRETDPYRPSVKMSLPSWIVSEVM